MQKTAITSFIILILSTLIGCTQMSPYERQGTAIGTGVGAGLGAILGQAISKNTDGTLVGAGIGAALGGVAGNRAGWYVDRQEQELRSTFAASEAANIKRNQDVLTATFRGQTFFDHNSAILKPAGQVEIGRMAEVLNRYPQTMIEVSGHTDPRGTEQYNQHLSQQRADAVKNALIQHGIQPHRIASIGYGESRPLASNYAMNRRVEVSIIPDNHGV